MWIPPDYCNHFSKMKRCVKVKCVVSTTLLPSSVARKTLSEVNVLGHSNKHIKLEKKEKKTHSIFQICHTTSLPCSAGAIPSSSPHVLSCVSGTQHVRPPVKPLLGFVLFVSSGLIVYTKTNDSSRLRRAALFHMADQSLIVGDGRLSRLF